MYIVDSTCICTYVSFRTFLLIGVSKKVFLFMRATQSKNKKFFIVRLCRNLSNRHLLILFNKTYLLHIKICSENNYFPTWDIISSSQKKRPNVFLKKITFFSNYYVK